MSVWIIGGTGDSANIVDAVSLVTKYVVTVTTPEARQLYDVASVIVAAMNLDKMVQFCHVHKIRAIVDASHPFATEVSLNATAVARCLNLPYLRYERLEVEANAVDICTQLDSFSTLLQGNYLRNQRVLLTVGCKVLPLFQSWQSYSTLFARILPKLNSLEVALNSGFSSDRIIALRPPVTEELEKALLQNWRISLIVTKASGKPGGQDIKQKVAEHLGIPLITIARPKITYPQKTSDIEQVINFCLEYGSSCS